MMDLVYLRTFAAGELARPKRSLRYSAPESMLCQLYTVLHRLDSLRDRPRLQKPPTDPPPWDAIQGTWLGSLRTATYTLFPVSGRQRW